MQLRSKRTLSDHQIKDSHSSSNGYSVHSFESMHQHKTHGELINVQAKSVPRRIFNYTLFPLFLMSVIPSLSIVLWYTAVKCDGSYLLMVQKLMEGEGLIINLLRLWVDIISRLSADVWYILLGYCLFALVVMVITPGERVEGPLTAKGNTPVYCDNGFRCYIISLLAFTALTYICKQYGYSPTIVYDKFDLILVSTNILGHVLCTFLLIKGLTAPSDSDSGSSGNLLFDYYWGMELYPRVCGVDIKVFTNCRFGMTVWPLLCLTFALKSYELHGFVDSMWVCCALQMFYITKFFWWEAGYYQSIDIIVDRAGWMICWGCLSFIPAMYTLCSLFLVNKPVHLGPVYSAVILLAGTASIGINYWADYQRQLVRATKGDTLIWGKRPTLIRAKYWVSLHGEPKESLLLASGFWGIARHFNYIPELLLAFFWGVPGLFTHLMPYTYVIYLTILLVHRSMRDDEKCRRKYGEYWKQYCEKVPYKMLPGIF